MPGAVRRVGVSHQSTYNIYFVVIKICEIYASELCLNEHTLYKIQFIHADCVS